VQGPQSQLRDVIGKDKELTSATSIPKEISRYELRSHRHGLYRELRKEFAHHELLRSSHELTLEP